MIPRWSYFGASIATLVTDLVLLAAIWIVVARTVPIRRLFPVGAIIGVAILGFAVTVWATLLTDRFHIPWIVTAAVAPTLVLAGMQFLPVAGRIRLVHLLKSR